MLDFKKHLAQLIAIASIFSGLLSPDLGLNFAAGTAGEGAGDTGGDDTGVDDTGVDDTGVDDTGVDDTGVDDTGGDDTGGDDTGGDDTGGDDTGVDGTDSELQPDPDPCLKDPTLEGCEPTDDCDPSYPDTCIPSPPPRPGLWRTF